MKTKVTPRLRHEVEKYRLQFTCRDCAHYEPTAQSCAEGYPNHEHLDHQLLAAEVLFCKLFEAS